MTAHLNRAGDAAVRVLQARARGADLDLIDLQVAAWTAGKAGRRPPALPDLKEDLHVRQAAAFGAGDDEAAFALLVKHMSTAAGEHLLMYACHLVGDRCADQLLELAARDPAVWFSGRMLVRTHDPIRLLALVDATKLESHIVSTVCELAIHGRDTQRRVVEIEQRWAALNDARQRPEYLRAFREAELRVAAREDMEEAVDLLDSHADAWGYDQQDEGTEAVLGRLVRIDPTRACEIVADRDDPANQIAWLRPLVRWFGLPGAAQPIVDELLVREPSEDDVLLLSPLIFARAFDRLDRLLPRLGNVPADELAAAAPVAIARLRDAGFDDDAESARDRILSTLGDRSKSGGVAPQDLLDALSAAGRPPLVPWRPEPGIP